MPAKLNHTIVSVRDPHKAAVFLADLLGLPAPVRWGPFVAVTVENEVTLDYLATTDKVTPQHYAFLVSEPEFDEIFGRIRARGLPYFADPGHHQPGEINHHDGGRGVYWSDPDGHNLEIITRPYGSSAS